MLESVLVGKIIGKGKKATKSNKNFPKMYFYAIKLRFLTGFLVFSFSLWKSVKKFLIMSTVKKISKKVDISKILNVPSC